MATVLDGNSNASPGFASGTYAGTTAALTIQLGFRPNVFMCWNLTDGDDFNILHSSSLTTFVNIASAAATVTATWAQTDHGITLPASDNDINENGKTYAFIAFR